MIEDLDALTAKAYRTIGVSEPELRHSWARCRTLVARLIAARGDAEDCICRAMPEHVRFLTRRLGQALKRMHEDDSVW